MDVYLCTHNHVQLWQLRHQRTCVFGRFGIINIQWLHTIQSILPRSAVANCKQLPSFNKASVMHDDCSLPCLFLLKPQVASSQSFNTNHQYTTLMNPNQSETAVCICMWLFHLCWMTGGGNHWLSTQKGFVPSSPPRPSPTQTPILVYSWYRGRT